LSQSQQRTQRIIENVCMQDLLAYYGVYLRDYQIDSRGSSQISCPIHGQDKKPSAKYYKKSNSFHCWACGKTYNTIDLVKAIENLSFRGALYFLERFANLPPLVQEKVSVQEPELKFTLTYKGRIDILEKRIRNMQFKITLDKYILLFEMLDILSMSEDTQRLYQLEKKVLCLQ